MMLYVALLSVACAWQLASAEDYASASDMLSMEKIPMSAQTYRHQDELEGSTGKASADQVMQSLMDSAAGQGMVSRKQKPGVSVESKEIVSGVVEAFMHKQHLLPGEKSCLEKSVAQLTADVVGTGKDVVDAVKSLMPQQPGQPGLPQTQRTTATKQSNLMSEGIDGTMKIVSLVTLTTTLVKTCVKGDALRMLNETAHHLIDLKYLGHRLLVSGVDIAHFLANSIVSYESQHYHRFGKDIGLALRKVLLSNSNRSATLPEGVPEESIIQKTSEGIMDGFFIGGSDLRITDVARPDVDIKLDLHACIADNQPFFKDIFLALWNAIAQFSLNAGQHGLQFGNTTSASSATSSQWTGELMLALMQLPAALERCNVDSDTQGMLLEAIQTLPELRVQVKFPAAKAKVEQITKRMAKAVEDWTTWDFEKFGEELGKMLREFVLLMFPMKYSVDSSGRLRRQLSSSVVAGSAKHRTMILSVSLLGAASLSLLMGLLLARVRSTRAHVLLEETDLECDEKELVE
jgi:hypothetical protein